MFLQRKSGVCLLVLFQEGEQGVSSEQRVVGQLASICEQ